MTISLRSTRARMSASASSARVVARDDVHRDFVGAAVLRAAQRADRAGDARIHVRTGAGDDARGEGRGVELVLGVQDQRRVHRAHRRAARAAARRAAGAGSARPIGVVVGLHVDAAAVAGEVLPVQQHRAEAGDQLVGDVARVRRPGGLRAPAARVPSTEQPVRITSIGCALAGTQFQRLLHRSPAGRAGA